MQTILLYLLIMAVVVAVVFADSQEVDADGIGEHGLVEYVADRLRVGDGVAGVVDCHVAERVEAEFDGHMSHHARPAEWFRMLRNHFVDLMNPQARTYSVRDYL